MSRDGFEIRRNDDGSIDELLAANVDIHIEQMDKGGWYLGIYPAGTIGVPGTPEWFAQSWFRSKGRIRFRVEEVVA